MKLSEYFAFISYKRLSAVETDTEISHQHEFNGIGSLKEMFGTSKKEFTAKLAYLGEDLDEPLVADVEMTWYDAREKHLTRTEYRLYYKQSEVNKYMQEGDLMVVGLRPDGKIYFFIAQKDSTYANQLVLLFDLESDIGTTAKSKMIAGTKNDVENVDFVRSFILEELGIEVKGTDENYLEALLQKFPSGFPNTNEFSEFARSTIPGIDSKIDPDGALMKWMEREELLFRTLEKHLVSEKIKNIGTDVDLFMKLSLSIQNRRKARVGFALENHLERIFLDCEVQYSRGKETENNSKPDFVFPSIENYRDAKFPDEKLFMLGSKSTCKDRWRQVLAEAARIKNKHLLTLEPGISVNQTSEMMANNLNLVIPRELFGTYTNDQQKWLLSLKDFIALLD